MQSSLQSRLRKAEEVNLAALSVKLYDAELVAQRRQIDSLFMQRFRWFGPVSDRSSRPLGRTSRRAVGEGSLARLIYER